jgi:hypothetical protein
LFILISFINITILYIIYGIEINKIGGEMKKLITAVMMVYAICIFASDYSSSERREMKYEKNHASKDTVWVTYADGTEGFVVAQRSERATRYNLDDFSREYPTYLHAVDTYMFDEGYPFHYRVYAKDGETVVAESPELISAAGWNTYAFDTPLVIKDDFWLSVVPASTGQPGQFAQVVTTPSRSYIKNDSGEWEMWEKTWGDVGYFENYNEIMVSTYEDADVHVPLVRNLSGTENFMGYDADLSIIVQDQSAVISPMTSQYSTDGGLNWTDFEMTMQVKGNYTFTGTIPGQPDGTVALVKFFMEDEHANSAWSDEYEVMWSKDSPLLFEGFEGPAFPPENWTLQTTGAGFVRVDRSSSFISSLYEGQYSAAHMDDQGAQDDWLITSPVVLPDDKMCTLSFWQNGFFVEFYDFSEVCISTDMVNWTQVYETEFDPVNWELTEDIWAQIKFSLAPWAGQTVYVGFHYTGDYSHQWYIDNLRIMVDDRIPDVLDIYANKALLPSVGAYVNNPMEIFLELYDYTGINSVTGHYSFDGGSTETDVVFELQESGLWKGVIPAEAVEKEGYIYFSMEDAGGVTGDTDQYPVFFVADIDEPLIKSYSYGAPVFVETDITLTITFEDESDIASVEGYFSKDEWVNETPVVMTPAKIHTYTYSGTLPAETEETFAEVRFVITDTEGNILNSDPYPVRWLAGYNLFYDDFEGSNPDPTWITAGGTWGTVTNEYKSPTTSLHDSPSGDYGNNQNNAVTTELFDFSEFYAAMLYFWAKVDLENGYDYAYLEASTDDVEWTALAEFNGEGLDWEYYTVDLGAFATEPSVRLRFIVVTDAAVIEDGIYIDDVTLSVYTRDYSPPLIGFPGPENVCGTDDYTFTVKLTDVSGIEMVKVFYSVDGGEEFEVTPEIHSGPTGFYDLTIPAQPAGSKVKFKIYAKDSSVYANEAESKYYETYFGNNMQYENGEEFISYLDIIGNTSAASATAVAKRITMGPFPEDTGSTYKADLVGISIANYVGDDYPSDPMYVHIWADNEGQPGSELIAPVYTIQASTPENPYARTIVDLRPYAAELSQIEGDVFVGFTSAGSVTNVLYEQPTMWAGTAGYINYERSWLGMGDVDALSWSLQTDAVYHISAIIGEYTESGIDNVNIPLNAKLYQNYPNPFNPTTSIKFSIPSDSNVSLSVYNSAGQTVAELVKGNIAKGVHSVQFDGSGLTSGVYYTVLKVNNKVMTNKMIMLK